MIKVFASRSAVSRILGIATSVVVALTIFGLASCDSGPIDPATRKVPAKALYKDPTASPEDRAKDLLSYMSLAEKIGQMTQPARDYLGLDINISKFYIGSILSGGGSGPRNNTTQAWADMYDTYQKQALSTPLAIPMLYGIDAVHGNNNLKGATIFPHNIALGATANPDLVEKIARATALETAATGIRWTFAPTIAVPMDPRWGRTYEGFSENTELTGLLGAAAVRGFQGAADGSNLDEYPYVLATAKHFIGDGGTTGGIDQGNTELPMDVIRQRFLPPYLKAMEAGVGSIMVSFNSINGIKMHQYGELITGLLKEELGFKGLIVSDWAGIKQIPGTHKEQIEKGINAGIDLVMVPDTWKEFIIDLTALVEEGRVSMERIDDAVYRILYTKFRMGLFEQPMADRSYIDEPGKAEHRDLARQAVRESQVVLKNDGNLLPLATSGLRIGVVGKAAQDVGSQAGGWTITWQGSTGAITPGTTIWAGIQALVPEAVYAETAEALGAVDVAIVVAAEPPYAEMHGDSKTLPFPTASAADLATLKKRGIPVVTVLMSGRPIHVAPILSQTQALVASWLPGTEGDGVADVLFGKFAPTGKSPYTWFTDPTVLPVHSADLSAVDPAKVLFPFGHGLSW